MTIYAILSFTLFLVYFPMYNFYNIAMKKTGKPNGKNIEIALELLELSLILKQSVKKAMKKK